MRRFVRTSELEAERERHERTKRAAEKSWVRLRKALGERIAEKQAALERAEKAESERDRLAGVIAQTQAALSTVTVYEGLVDVSPVAMMVADLARDHEELEARIEAALVFTSTATTSGLISKEEGDALISLLRGGPRFPDDPGELVGD